MENKSKSILISFVAAAYFLLAATALFSYSVQSFKIATPVATWLKEKHLDKGEILVYNKRLPSLAFTLNHSVISLYDGDRSLNREVQFEKDDTWKTYLYNLTQKSEQKRLEILLKSKPSVLIAYKIKLPKTQAWLKSYYPQEETVGKWTIYYQKTRSQP
jgi:4-amino-4-deoxy-L-arabinose transferase